MQKNAWNVLNILLEIIDNKLVLTGHASQGDPIKDNRLLRLVSVILTPEYL